MEWHCRAPRRDAINRRDVFEDGGDAEFFQNCRNGSRRSARSCSLTQYSLFVVKMFSLAVKQPKSAEFPKYP